MQRTILHISLSWSILILCLLMTRLGFSTEKDEEIIYHQVWSAFVFNWGGPFTKEKLTHQFFSLKFQLDGKGNLTDIVPSVDMDTALFNIPVQKLKKRLPPDLFRSLKLKNTSVIFPVFLFIIPQTEDTLYFDHPAQKNPNFKPDTLIYDREVGQKMRDIWQFHPTSSSLHGEMVFPPIVYFLQRGIPDIQTIPDTMQTKRTSPLDTPNPLLKLPKQNQNNP